MNFSSSAYICRLSIYPLRTRYFTAAHKLWHLPEEKWQQLREQYALPESSLDLALPDTKFHAYEMQVLQHVEKGLNPLTASNKLASFAPAISEQMIQELDVLLDQMDTEASEESI